MSYLDLMLALNIGILPIMLNFLCHLAEAQPGAEGSYSLLVERTLERVCDTLTLETERDDFEARFGYAQTIFSYLAVLFEHMQNAQTYSRGQAGQRAVLGVLKALKQLGILDLIGKMFLMFKPALDGRVGHKVLSAFLMRVVSTIVRKISTIAPRHIIDPTFGYYALEWVKFHDHLIYLTHMGSTTPDPQIAHWKSCSYLWREIAETLGMSGQIGIILSSPICCSYARCPNPKTRCRTDVFICGACYGAIYCSAYCQVRDWEHDRKIESHRQACKLSIEL
ncbi:unnamed protein product [Rhizoctonia solani]|uniref:MYND-type domain-containing protein n=1 Tax=Rhizoctonia solani TaxID=456999 RepID=A0A8H3HP66_9AGAM|nr:unnamed protein product [Rhizoctonia solani]